MIGNMTLVEIKLMAYIGKCYKVLYRGDIHEGTGEAQAWHRFEFKKIFLDNMKTVVGELKQNVTEDLFDHVEL
jgi:hypothetical protein